MLSAVESLGPWSWIIAGAVLLALELAAPGAFMMWLGLAAALVGLLSFVVDWPWQAQGVAFALFALGSVPLWRRFARKTAPTGDGPLLNRREGLLGRVVTLDKPIVNGAGTVRIDDTIWRVSGPDCAAGSQVVVVRVDGSDLRVEPAA